MAARSLRQGNWSSVACHSDLWWRDRWPRPWGDVLYPRSRCTAIVVDMKKQLFTGIVLAATLYAAARRMRKSGESSSPASIPIVRAMWPVTEDLRQLASRCRWRDLIEGWGRADTNQHLGQRMPGECADDVASGRVLG